MNKNLIESRNRVAQPRWLISGHRFVAKIFLLVLAGLMLPGAVRLAKGNTLGPAFTYHGRLQTNAVPVNGRYDLTFALYTNLNTGSVVAGPLTNTYVAVNDGVFTVRLDFGPGVFDGTAYWLEIGVRTNGDGDFTILSPRHELTATPYAVYAENSRAGGLDGNIPEAALKGTYGHALSLTNPGNAFVGDGSALTGVNATTVGGMASSNFWSTSGNAGTSPFTGNFLGTIDNRPLELRVNKLRALRLEPTTSASNLSNIVNVLGGSPNNFIGTNVYGGTIAGGGALTYIVSSGGLSNVVIADFGTVGGGKGNIAKSTGATVAGGEMNSSGDGVFTDTTVGGGSQNVATGPASTVGGGQGNTASGWDATVSGGTGNSATGFYSAVGGGTGNTSSGEMATVPGGQGNSAGGMGSFAAGQFAQTTRDGSFVWGDGTQNPFHGAAADNAFNVLSSGGAFFYNGTNGVHIDGLGNNDGNLDFGLKFGGALGSGEGIGSKRTSGGNQFGLDFYTSANNRMSIDSNGKVGINTTSPSERLEVNGNYVLIDGANADNGSGSIDAYIGGNGSGSDVQVGSMNAAITTVGFWNNAGAGSWMHIACSSITIHGGADLAEPFQMVDGGSGIPQGAVVVIDEKNPGQLRMSDRAYDSRVAGVVSGANGIHPGIQLLQQGALEGGKNVALTGRVYVQADTANGSIQPGDLLTTSPTPGHAMKVTEHLKAQGAILGKAMTGLDQGKGMVLVLVTLQ